MQEEILAKKVKGILHFTDILDNYPESYLRRVHADLEGKRITYRVFGHANRFILRTLNCHPNDFKEYNAFKAKYTTHTKMAKMTKNVLKPITIQEYKNEETGGMHVEALYEYGEKDLVELIGKADAYTAFSIFKNSLEPLAMLTEGTSFHFDIKPENIIFEKGAVKIVEFGTSKSRTPETGISKLITVTDSYANSESTYTYAYCPPEVHKGACKLSKVDVYSWGITMYQVMTGRSVEELEREVREYKLPGRNYEGFLRMVRSISLSGDREKVVTQQLIPVLLRVLSENPEERPEFKDLKDKVELMKLPGNLQGKYRI
eukprot:TRINITY_DN12831_c0_g3_i1.p1 TRINITY_DN12831_c0_g3~~TRINITY_DN12831_c0_g3_i1.p1  ORF type:complete len:317 (-),score=74.73 TRINITY_DN12831_c0_g3_i1:1756-2706(-)